MNIEERNRLVIALSKIQIPPTPSRQEVIGTMLADEIVCFLESFGWLSPEQVRERERKLIERIEVMLDILPESTEGGFITISNHVPYERWQYFKEETEQE